MLPGFQGIWHARCRACVSWCVFLCVWQAKQWLVKGCDTGPHTGATTPGPQGLDFTILSYIHTEVEADMLFTEGHWGLVTCVCNHHPLLLLLPAMSPHLASSPFFSRSRRISKQTPLERRINEININILRHWQACKLKSGDGTLAIFSEEMSLETEWISKGGFQIGRACVCTHELKRARLCQPSVLIKHTGV